MKRVGYLKEQIVDLDNIALAAYKTFKGHRYSKDVLVFIDNFLENIVNLKTDLVEETYMIGNYRYFKIFDPKERLICAAHLHERIIHHAIMNVCHEIFDRKQIYDSYASRKDKGTYKALERIKSGTTRFRYYAKLDVRKYFDSIDHSILTDMLRKIIKDKWLLRLLEQIISSYHTEAGKGLPIGNLTSQYFANHYLSGLDHRMKEKTCVKVYVRYMDDVVMLGSSKEEIREFVDDYIEYAESFLKLRIKPVMTGEIKYGIPFLGYRVFPTHLALSGISKRRFRHKLLNYKQLYNEEIIDEATYSLRISQLCAFTKHAESKIFRKNVIELPG